MSISDHDHDTRGTGRRALASFRTFFLGPRVVDTRRNAQRENQDNPLPESTRRMSASRGHSFNATNSDNHPNVQEFQNSGTQTRYTEYTPQYNDPQRSQSAGRSKNLPPQSDWQRGPTDLHPQSSRAYNERQSHHLVTRDQAQAQYEQDGQYVAVTPVETSRIMTSISQTPTNHNKSQRTIALEHAGTCDSEWAAKVAAVADDPRALRGPGNISARDREQFEPGVLRKPLPTIPGYPDASSNGMNITYSNTNPRRESQQTTTARTFYGYRAAEYPSTMAASWPSGETSQAYHFTHSQSADGTPNTPVRWTESETEHHVRYPRLKAQEMEPVDPISRLQAKLQDYVEKLREEQRYSASLEKDLKQLERKAMIEREDPKVRRKARTSQQFKREIADNKRCIDEQAEEIRTQQAHITRLQHDYNTKANETDTLDKDLKKARQSLDFLDGKLRTAETNFQHAHVRNQELQQEKQQAEQTHIENMNFTFERIQKLEDELEDSRRNYEEQRAADTARHASIIEETQLRHAERLSQMEDNHGKVVKDLSSKIASKDSRIAAYSSNGNYKPIHDSAFRQTLQSLSQQVKNLTLHVPRTDKITVGNELDRTGYLGRSAQQKSRGWQNLVISICWDIIIRGFFAFPLGFGSLGCQGEGFQMLVKFYQVFAQPDSDGELQSPLTHRFTLLPTSGPTSNSSSFPTDKETNLGRAWLFNGILRGVRSNAIREGYIAMFDENVFCVSEELTETLERLSGRQLDPQALALIKNLARECGVLALEMGAQRAQVKLESCQYGDMITPGERFMADTESSSKPQVDVMIQPGLVRTGDGRDDLISETVISKGNIVSLKDELGR